MELIVPDKLAKELQECARSSGLDVDQLAMAAIQEKIRGITALDELLKPIREAFVASGLSEEQALEIFESEKHAHRRENPQSRS